MSDKAKRGRNKQARTKILLFLSGVFVSLFACLYLFIDGNFISGLRLIPLPNETIIYNANDANGNQNWWVVDFNNLHNPRQLTFHTGADKQIGTFPHISASGEQFIYRIGTSGHNEVWFYDLTTGKNEHITICGDFFERCAGYTISPNGQSMSYLARPQRRGDPLTLILYDFYTQVSTPLYEHTILDFNSPLDRPFPLPQWLSNSRIIFRDGVDSDSQDYIIYDILTHQIISRQNLQISNLSYRQLSPDGTRFYDYDRGAPGESLDKLYIWTLGIADEPLVFFEAENSLSIYDWHPDNIHLLGIDALYRNPVHERWDNSVNLYNSSTGTTETLFTIGSEFSLIYCSFNESGTHILCRKNDRETNDGNFVLYDATTGYERRLPISGFSPFWVNRGQ